MRLAHLVEAGTLGVSGGILGLETVLDLDVEIAAVLLVGPVVQGALDLLALLDGKDVLQVEHGLLPVSVLCVRASGEADGLVAGAEVNVEPGHQGVDEVVAPRDKIEGAAEGQVFHCALVKVEGKNLSRIRHDSLHLDGVHQGLGEGGLLEGGVVEAVDVVPDCAVFLLAWTLG